MMETSILIPTKNGAEDLEACLAAIYTQKGTGPFEVIVIDSGSTDGTLEIAGRYPVRIEKIPPETFHHARTRNYAASLANGEFLVFLSQDAIPASDAWLRTTISNFNDQSVGATYGRQLPRHGSTLERQETLEAVYGRERVVKDPSRFERKCGKQRASRTTSKFTRISGLRSASSTQVGKSSTNHKQPSITRIATALAGSSSATLTEAWCGTGWAFGIAGRSHPC